MENSINILREISKKLSVLIALQLQGESEMVEVKENVGRLSRFGLTDSEIAEILGISESTSKSQFNRSKKKLREILEGGKA